MGRRFSTGARRLHVCRGLGRRTRVALAPAELASRCWLVNRAAEKASSPDNCPPPSPPAAKQTRRGAWSSP